MTRVYYNDVDQNICRWLEELIRHVRVLPQESALAELQGRREDAEALRLLRQAILQEGDVRDASISAEEAWASAGEEAKDRVRLVFGDAFTRRTFRPLSSGEPARAVRLRGYGNAIVPQVGQAFIEAFIEALKEN